MSLFKSRSYSRRSAGVFLLVGVLAGVTVGGGVGVIAASSTKTVTVCANKKTNVLRYAKNGKCVTKTETKVTFSSTKTVTVCANKKTNVLRYAKKRKCVTKTETKVTLNQTGAAGAKGDPGAAGAKGDPGAAGAKGDSGAAGAKGDSGAAGAKGDSGAAGANGDPGAAGAKGDPGAAGAKGDPGAAVAITQLSICGVGGTSLCKIGMTGPGGGVIFFVDYDDQYVGLNYLEAAPVGWGNGLLNVNLGGLSGETAGSATVDPVMKWCSSTLSLLGLDAWANSAVGAGASNTSTADTTCAGGAIQAASDYAGGSQSDWFLPSVGEAMLMYTNLRQVGVGGFASGLYWSSSESGANYAWSQSFAVGSQNVNLKTLTNYVRPVRAF